MTGDSKSKGEKDVERKSWYNLPPEFSLQVYSDTINLPNFDMVMENPKGFLLYFFTSVQFAYADLFSLHKSPPYFLYEPRILTPVCYLSMGSGCGSERHLRLK